MQRIRAMEQTISLSEKEKSLKGAISSRNDDEHLDHIRDLEKALRLETQRRVEADKKVEQLLQSRLKDAAEINTNKENDNFSSQPSEMKTSKTSLATDKSSHLEISVDPSILKLLDRASTLLSTRNDQSNDHEEELRSEDFSQQYRLTYQPANNDDDTNGEEVSNPTLTLERMEECHELVTAFHLEHQSDNEGVISRDDILWLFGELKLRFEDICRGYKEERLKRLEAMSTKKKGCELDDADVTEWKECLMSLVEMIGKATKQLACPSYSLESEHGFEETSQRRNLNHTNNKQKDDHEERQSPQQFTAVQQMHEKAPAQKSVERLGTPAIRMLQNEITKLNHRIVSLSNHHNETCNSLYEDMETRKHEFEEQIYTISQKVKSLESKLLDRENFIVQLQEKNRLDHELLQGERKKVEMGKEGTQARIKYLEDMVVDLQVELKKEKCLHAKGQDMNVNNNECSIDGEKYASGSSYGSDYMIVEVTNLRNEVKSLGNSLADSESRRAQLLDDFHAEREKYIAQYKQMSELLKQFL